MTMEGSVSLLSRLTLLLEEGSGEVRVELDGVVQDGVTQAHLSEELLVG